MNLESIRSEWRALLDQPLLDPDELRQVHARYHAAQRQEAVYRALYNRMRGEYREAIEARKAELLPALEKLSKDELFHAANVRIPEQAYKRNQYTRGMLLDMALNNQLAGIPDDHQRVKMAWELMTDRQRQGLESF